MTTELAEIRAQSKRQAMDWWLVLVTQDIASTLIQSPEDGNWSLVLDARDHVRARESILQYRLDYRRWAWRRHMIRSGLVFHAGGLVWVLLLGMIYWLDERSGGVLKAKGILASQFVAQGEWWRLFTAMTLHADVAHLAMNCCMVFLFGGLSMARFGVGWSVCCASLAGLLGNLATLEIYPSPHQSLGASGIVMGTLGLVAVHSFNLLRHGWQAARFALTGFLGALMLFVLFGLDPRSNVVAHAGGFAGGTLLGLLLVWVPRERLAPGMADKLLVTIWALVLLGTWGLALRS
ncbi:MAG TPA: rhomboid family intramembrane serine protease [Candidatus Paceibacterota bacterium]|nr:rhomboid family intramembrane serine protease [Verrucomicrobiota bacterium]HRY46475.1 rhomboid family intramembrane serine protease [Candidatus Paceibacterota bacterium]HSA01421.1 rhomboid family intramembrane serine protease [Candidatus Paceibacterota bacterium]